jgi:hypothetical protein
MKNRIVERVFIYIAFNLHKITSIIFAFSLLLAVFSNFLLNHVNIIISYIFWFSFGAYIFSICLRNSTSFLKKKFEENNSYYYSLLAKNKK